MAINSERRPSARTNSEVLDKEPESRLPLMRQNFILMAVAGVMIVLGFLLMVGGTSSMERFNADIFSTCRVVIGPAIAFLGFIFMGVGIMYSPKKK